jgi:dTDP-glucose 4,6-dehydratase
MRGKKVPVYGDGKNIREWIYVSDNCKYISKVIEKGAPGQTYNIGSSVRLTNLEIVQGILRIMNLSENYIEFVTDRLGHDRRYALNSTKTHQTINTRFESDFYEMLEKTIQWYQTNFNI